MQFLGSYPCLVWSMWKRWIWALIIKIKTLTLKFKIKPESLFSLQLDKLASTWMLCVPPPPSIYLIFGFFLPAKWQHHSSKWSNNPAAAKAFPSDNQGWVSAGSCEGWSDAFFPKAVNNNLGEMENWLRVLLSSALWMCPVDVFCSGLTQE